MSGRFNLTGATKIYHNHLKGNSPFKPDHGQHGGCSWFLVDGNPYAGITPDKNIGIEAHVADMHVTDLPDDFLDTKLNEMAHNNPTFQGAALHRLTWDAIGDHVRLHVASGVAKLYVPQGAMSRQGSGHFLIVSPAGRSKVTLNNPQALAQTLGNNVVGRLQTTINNREQTRVASFNVEVPSKDTQLEAQQAAANIVNSLPHAPTNQNTAVTSRRVGWGHPPPQKWDAKINLTFQSYVHAHNAFKHIAMHHPAARIVLPGNHGWPGKATSLFTGLNAPRQPVNFAVL